MFLPFEAGRWRLSPERPTYMIANFKPSLVTAYRQSCPFGKNFARERFHYSASELTKSILAGEALPATA